MAKSSTQLIDERSRSSLAHTGGGVIVDLGTGDGRFVYQSAKKHPDRFYLGIDAVARGLEKISEKIHRKPAKGGLPNVLFVQAAIESLPSEFDGIADEVHIHFPWGSLLGGIATGNLAVLESVRRICAPGAWLEVLISLDWERDSAEAARLGVRPLTSEFLASDLIPRYRAAGFDVTEYGVLPGSKWPKFCTSWAKRLAGNTNRSLTFLIARATEL